MSLNKIVFFLVTYQAAFVVEIQPSAHSMFNNYVAMERLGAWDIQELALLASSS